MGFDRKTFSIRTGTAIIFAAVMLTGLLWNKWSFILLFLVVLSGSWAELHRLIQKISPGRIALTWVAGLVYLAVPVGLLIYMRLSPADADDNLLKVVPCAIIFSIWINDTMAYICGSFFGKTPLSRISPKKTVEGTAGGIALAVLTMTLIGAASGYLRVVDWLMISLISAVTGTAGDLLESKLKRMAGVKDSGKIMPGHGGFLDRFDSLLVAIPFVFIYWVLFMHT